MTAWNQSEDLCHSLNNSGLVFFPLLISFFLIIKSCKIAFLSQNLQKIITCYMKTSDSVGIEETDFLHWSWDVSKRSLIKNAASKNEHFYSWDYYLGAYSTLSWFSLNEKSIEVKTETVNFPRGSSIVHRSSNILNSHIRATNMSSYKAATAAQVQFTEVWHYSSPQPSSILCLMRLGNISKYSTFDYCENMWEKN